MPSNRRDLIFRVFVSSTFSDLVEERNALQAKTFPALREYCRLRGARFQAIDLRWGVSEEAALDQQTMNICRDELGRCQRLSPKPNFIVLLGNRYGWRPLPPQIDAREFEALLAVLTKDEQDRLAEWYRRDDNAVPPEYVLLPRKVDVPENADDEQRKQARQNERDLWNQIESDLHALLLKAAHQALEPGTPQHNTYVDSATHQEIRCGALEAHQPEDHVFCYFREIHGLPADDTAEGYRDMANGKPDKDADHRLKALKDELRGRLPKDHVHNYAATLQQDHPEYDLPTLCKDVEEDLRAVIAEGT